ncbi:MAG: hypothetical protein IJ120_10805 [Solobacterium sp.]|nr:hypothetical protein [Solobacterium sp.]
MSKADMNIKDANIYYKERKRKDLNHSVGYDRFYEGYVEYVFKSDPKRRIHRVYAGDYWQADCGDEQYRLQKITYAVFFVIIAVLFLTAGVQPVKCNNTWYVALPCFVSVFSLFMLLLGVGIYIAMPRTMMAYQYRSGSTRIKRWSYIAFIGLTVEVFAVLLYFVLHFREKTWVLLLMALAYFVCAVLSYAIYTMEDRLAYRKIKNDVTLPEDIVVYKNPGLVFDKILNNERLD